ncbi:MAG: LLM class flavin-dependent oxidoreductase [Thermoplasmata archaeon]|nr:LLM class flavin-dependent oxidoreductase [Thermoplasmata archaeon]
MPRLLNVARIADEEGLSTLWVADDAFYRGAFPMAVACATVTTNLRIGLGCVTPYNHPPAWMAKDFATLQELADGRAILGIGAGSSPPLTAQGVPWTKPLSAVRDSVSIVRQLLDGEECSYSGERFSVQGVKLSFEPIKKRSSIFIAAMFPRSLKQAGEIADGVIISVLCPPTYIAAARKLIEEGVRNSGKDLDTFEIVQYVPMVVADDGENARRLAKRYVGFLLQFTFKSGDKRWELVAELGNLDLDELSRIYERLNARDKPEEVIPDSLLDKLAIAGTPRGCLELIQTYKASGATELVAMLPPWSNIEEQVSTIGRRLVPEWSRY